MKLGHFFLHTYFGNVVYSDFKKDKRPFRLSLSSSHCLFSSAFPDFRTSAAAVRTPKRLAGKRPKEISKLD